MMCRDGEAQLMAINSNIFVQESQKRLPERSWNGERLCHPERSEGSHVLGNEILRFAQDDTCGGAG